MWPSNKGAQTFIASPALNTPHTRKRTFNYFATRKYRIFMVTYIANVCALI